MAQHIRFDYYANNAWQINKVDFYDLNYVDLLHNPQKISLNISNTARTGSNPSDRLNSLENIFNKFQKVRLVDGETGAPIFYGKIDKITPKYDNVKGQILNIEAYDNLHELMKNTINKDANYSGTNITRASIIKDIISGDGNPTEEDGFIKTISDLNNIETTLSTPSNPTNFLAGKGEDGKKLSRRLKGSKKSALRLIEEFANEDESDSIDTTGFAYFLDNYIGLGNSFSGSPTFNYFSRGNHPPSNSSSDLLTLQYGGKETNNTRGVLPNYSFPRHSDEVITKVRIDYSQKYTEKETVDDGSGGTKERDGETYTTGKSITAIRAIINLTNSSYKSRFPSDGVYHSIIGWNSPSILTGDKVDITPTFNFDGLTGIGRLLYWKHIQYNQYEILIGENEHEYNDRSLSNLLNDGNGYTIYIAGGTANSPKMQMLGTILSSVRESIEQDIEHVMENYDIEDTEEILDNALKILRLHDGGTKGTIRGEVTLVRYPFIRIPFAINSDSRTITMNNWKQKGITKGCIIRAIDGSQTAHINSISGTTITSSQNLLSSAKKIDGTNNYEIIVMMRTGMQVYLSNFPTGVFSSDKRALITKISYSEGSGLKHTTLSLLLHEDNIGIGLPNNSIVNIAKNAEDGRFRTDVATAGTTRRNPTIRELASETWEYSGNLYQSVENKDREVYWTEGTLTLADGKTFDILKGTGTIPSSGADTNKIHYIYFDSGLDPDNNDKYKFQFTSNLDILQGQSKIIIAWVKKKVPNVQFRMLGAPWDESIDAPFNSSIFGYELTPSSFFSISAQNDSISWNHTDGTGKIILKDETEYILNTSTNNTITYGTAFGSITPKDYEEYFISFDANSSTGTGNNKRYNLYLSDSIIDATGSGRIMLYSFSREEKGSDKEIKPFYYANERSTTLIDGSTIKTGTITVNSMGANSIAASQIQAGQVLASKLEADLILSSQIIVADTTAGEDYTAISKRKRLEIVGRTNTNSPSIIGYNEYNTGTNNNPTWNVYETLKITNSGQITIQGRDNSKTYIDDDGISLTGNDNKIVLSILNSTRNNRNHLPSNFINYSSSTNINDINGTIMLGIDVTSTSGTNNQNKNKKFMLSTPLNMFLKNYPIRFISPNSTYNASSIINDLIEGGSGIDGITSGLILGGYNSTNGGNYLSLQSGSIANLELFGTKTIFKKNILPNSTTPSINIGSNTHKFNELHVKTLYADSGGGSDIHGTESSPITVKLYNRLDVYGSRTVSNTTTHNRIISLSGGTTSTGNTRGFVGITDADILIHTTPGTSAILQIKKDGIISWRGAGLLSGYKDLKRSGSNLTWDGKILFSLPSNVTWNTSALTFGSSGTKPSDGTTHNVKVGFENSSSSHSQVQLNSFFHETSGRSYSYVRLGRVDNGIEIYVKDGTNAINSQKQYIQFGDDLPSNKLYKLGSDLYWGGKKLNDQKATLADLLPLGAEWTTTKFKTITDGLIINHKSGNEDTLEFGRTSRYAGIEFYSKHTSNSNAKAYITIGNMSYSGIRIRADSTSSDRGIYIGGTANSYRLYNSSTDLYWGGNKIPTLIGGSTLRVNQLQIPSSGTTKLTIYNSGDIYTDGSLYIEGSTNSYQALSNSSGSLQWNGNNVAIFPTDSSWSSSNFQHGTSRGFRINYTGSYTLPTITTTIGRNASYSEIKLYSKYTSSLSTRESYILIGQNQLYGVMIRSHGNSSNRGIYIGGSSSSYRLYNSSTNLYWGGNKLNNQIPTNATWTTSSLIFGNEATNYTSRSITLGAYSASSNHSRIQFLSYYRTTSGSSYSSIKLGYLSNGIEIYTKGGTNTNGTKQYISLGGTKLYKLNTDLYWGSTKLNGGGSGNLPPTGGLWNGTTFQHGHSNIFRIVWSGSSTYPTVNMYFGRQQNYSGILLYSKYVSSANSRESSITVGHSASYGVIIKGGSSSIRGIYMGGTSDSYRLKNIGSTLYWGGDRVSLHGHTHTSFSSSITIGSSYSTGVSITTGGVIWIKGKSLINLNGELYWGGTQIS